MEEICHIISEIFCSNKVQFYIVKTFDSENKENQMDKSCFLGYNRTSKKMYVKWSNDGIVNKVRIDKNPYFCKEAGCSDIYNPNIDLNSHLPIITYPISRYDNEDVIRLKKDKNIEYNYKMNDVIAVFQADIWSKTRSANRMCDFENMKGTTFELLDNFCMFLRPILNNQKINKEIDILIK